MQTPTHYEAHLRTQAQTGMCAHRALPLCSKDTDQHTFTETVAGKPHMKSSGDTPPFTSSSLPPPGHPVARAT